MKIAIQLLCGMSLCAVITWATDYKEPYLLEARGGSWLKPLTCIMVTNQGTWVYSGKYGDKVPEGTEATIKFRLAEDGEAEYRGWTTYSRRPFAASKWIRSRTGNLQYQTTKAEIEWEIDKEG